MNRARRKPGGTLQMFTRSVDRVDEDTSAFAPPCKILRATGDPVSRG
jgi:hypothetical protein